MTQLAEGSVIAGKYRLERRLAGGGMGSIWRGMDLQLDVPVAVKFMLPELVEKEPQRARFEREAKAAAKIRSPHVVHMYEYGVDGGVPYIVMELLEGEDLGQRIKKQGQLPIDEVVRIVTEICKGLHRAHQREIIHRDLKPGNIFLSAPDDDLIKILDFGIAKVTGIKEVGQEITTTGQLLGSPQYMSPEQARGMALDGRSDLWSLAVIIYRMLTGRRPFEAKEMGDLIVRICTDPVTPPSHFRPGLSPAIDTFFDQALAREPFNRFQSAKELAAAFAQAAQGSAAPVLGTLNAQPAVNENSWDQSLTSSPPSQSVVTADTDAVAVVPAKRPRAYWGVIASVAVLLIGVGAAIALSMHSSLSAGQDIGAAGSDSAAAATSSEAQSSNPAAVSNGAASGHGAKGGDRAGAAGQGAASSRTASSSELAPSSPTAATNQQASASGSGAPSATAAGRPANPALPTRPAPAVVRPKPTPAPYSTSDLGY